MWDVVQFKFREFVQTTKYVIEMLSLKMTKMSRSLESEKIKTNRGTVEIAGFLLPVHSIWVQAHQLLLGTNVGG
jgi:hypothetical protein